MKTFSKIKWMDRALFTVLIFLFILPLLLITALAAFPRAKWLDSDWLQNRTLWHEDQPVNVVWFWSWKHFFTAKYQSALAYNFEVQFPARELLARLYNESIYRTLGQGTAPDKMAIGKDGTIFPTVYLEDYFLSRPEKDDVEKLVQNIATIQEACRKSGQAFAFIITPSKATAYPEKAPLSWQSRYDPRPRGYELLVPLFKKYGIHFVDGVEITRKTKASLSLPVFPKGGAHWGSPAALQTANVLLEVLREQGLPVNQLAAKTTFLDNPYTKEDESDREILDYDAYSCLNLALPCHYPVAHCKIFPDSSSPKNKLSLVFVGGSFLYRPIYQLLDSEQFAQIDYYYYYKTVARYLLPGHTYSASKGQTDFEGDIFGADALILELNEQAISKPFHLEKFFGEALQKLPEPGQPRKSFSYKGSLRIDLGKPFYFCGADVSTDFLSIFTDGFSVPKEKFFWSDGKTARMSIVLPAKIGRNQSLHVDVGAFIQPKIPEQKVDIYVNDEKVTQWTFNVQLNDADRAIPLPQNVLNANNDQKLILRFEIDRPTSPFEIGYSLDKRKLGIRLNSISLSR